VSQIRELDKMVSRLKQARLNCQRQLDKDRETMEWIEKEESAIKVKYDPLCERLGDREETATTLRTQIEELVAGLAGVRCV
jgi:chromosome segregation ATPase